MKKLGFGLMRLPLTDKDDTTSIDIPQVEKMVDTFLERGFTYFDTAYVYHKSKSEEILREVLVKRHDRSKFTVATKMPVFLLKEKSDVQRIFNEQLEKCGVDYFDYYLLHSLSKTSYKTAEEFDCFNFVLNKVKEGKVRHFGFSFHDTPEVLDDILTHHPEVEFVQLQINYRDWTYTSVRAKECYETAVRHGKKVVVMEPVRGGALANVPDEAKQIFKNAAPDMSPASWAIRFAASLENVMVVLSGMSDYDQLCDNTGYMENFVPLSDDEYKIISQAAEIVNSSITIPCTSCRYCTDGCPSNIAIPDYFALFNADKNGDSKQNEYIKLKEKFGSPADCKVCRKCEEVCPQHIRITGWLKETAYRFERRK